MNPLYVVSHKGKQVEVAYGRLDFIAKKLHLTKLIDAIRQVLQELAFMIRTSAMVKALEEWLENLVKQYWSPAN